MRLSFSKIAPIIGGAVLAGLGASSASAQSVSVDLRILSVQFGGVTTTPNGTTVTAKSDLIPVIGQTVRMGVYATVSGSSVQTLQSVQGSFLSGASTAGQVKGNMASSFSYPFSGNGSRNGTPVDRDGDGDSDIALGDFAAVSPFEVGPDNVGNGVVAGSYTVTNTGSSVEYRIGSLNFVVSALGTQTPISFDFDSNNSQRLVSFVGVHRNSYTDGDGNPVVTYGTDAGDPNQGEINVGSQLPPTALTFSGTPVLVGLVPEPTSLGLLGLAGAGLVARRRRNA